MAKNATHEAISRSDEIKLGSDRSFGIVFAVVFALVALWPLTGGNDIRLWAAATAATFLIFALVYAKALRPLNVLWFRFGMLLHHIVTPVVMGLVFFLTVVPTGLIMRALGKDLLALKLKPAAETYWIERAPPGPEPETLKQQF